MWCASNAHLQAGGAVRHTHAKHALPITILDPSATQKKSAHYLFPNGLSPKAWVGAVVTVLRSHFSCFWSDVYGPEKGSSDSILGPRHNNNAPLNLLRRRTKLLSAALEITIPEGRQLFYGNISLQCCPMGRLWGFHGNGLPLGLPYMGHP